MAKTPWKGINKMTTDQIAERVYVDMQAMGGTQATDYLSNLSEYLDEQWGYNTDEDQDMLYDYIDDWTDFKDRTAPTNLHRPTVWTDYKQGNQYENQSATINLGTSVTDELDERLNRIEARLQLMHDYLLALTDTASPGRYERMQVFRDFSKQFNEAGTEAAEVSKAVSDLSRMAAELASAS